MDCKGISLWGDHSQGGKGSMNGVSYQGGVTGRMNPSEGWAGSADLPLQYCRWSEGEQLANTRIPSLKMSMDIVCRHGGDKDGRGEVVVGDENQIEQFAALKLIHDGVSIRTDP